MERKYLIYGCLVGGGAFILGNANPNCGECFEYIDKVPHAEIRVANDFNIQNYGYGVASSVSAGTISIGNIIINWSYPIQS